MSLLIETIKCKDGKIFNLDYHNYRLNHARLQLYGAKKSIDLAREIKIPEPAMKGLYKCRVLYSNDIDNIEFIKHRYRKIESLKIVRDDEIDYQFKYSDRSRLNSIFEKRDECDDILIVKNDFVTDCFAANVVFFDGSKWWTPDTPLLAGTQRERLLKEGKIFVSQIKPDDLNNFRKAGLINAMQDLTEMPVIYIKKILF